MAEKQEIISFIFEIFEIGYNKNFSLNFLKEAYSLTSEQYLKVEKIVLETSYESSEYFAEKLQDELENILN